MGAKILLSQLSFFPPILPCHLLPFSYNILPCSLLRSAQGTQMTAVLLLKLPCLRVAELPVLYCWPQAACARLLVEEMLEGQGRRLPPGGKVSLALVLEAVKARYPELSVA